METLSVRAAARHLDIAEKTIRRWIASGKLPATRDTKGQYLIKREDVEAMSIQNVQPIDQTRLDRIEQRLDAIEAHLHTLPTTQEQEQPIAPMEHPIPAPQLPRQKASAEPVQSEMPPDLIGLAEYAHQRNIPENTLKKAVKAGRIPVVRGRWKVGRSYVQVALDAEGRAKVRELYGVNQSAAPSVPAAESAQQDHT